MKSTTLPCKAQIAPRMRHVSVLPTEGKACGYLACSQEFNDASTGNDLVASNVNQSGVLFRFKNRLSR